MRLHFLGVGCLGRALLLAREGRRVRGAAAQLMAKSGVAARLVDGKVRVVQHDEALVPLISLRPLHVQPHCRVGLGGGHEPRR